MGFMLTGSELTMSIISFCIIIFASLSQDWVYPVYEVILHDARKELS
jgi:hypothetical protein